jgi:hypothetical protein
LIPRSLSLWERVGVRGASAQTLTLTLSRKRERGPDDPGAVAR